MVVILNNRNDIKMPNTDAVLSYKKYKEEVCSSLTLVSPFGWGEICGRDFEAFVFGTTLIKGDMSHLITYPDIYINGETYLGFKWDFTDFEELLDSLKTREGKKHAIEIASNGQQLYKKYISNQHLFVKHILNQFRMS